MSKKKHPAEKPAWFPHGESDLVTSTAKMVGFAIRDLKQRRESLLREAECLEGNIEELERELTRMVAALEGRQVVL